MKDRHTGILTDLNMLLHRSKKTHPQTPYRLTSILNMLNQKKYLSDERVEYISEYQRLATDEEIKLVYSQKYIDFLKKLWPSASHRTDITILDTYFNEHSQRIARLSTGGMLEGIDHVISGRWKNGFALIRPPGHHHSNGRMTINGFCILNNIAIGARYIQKKYGMKKIAIIDYDIHQGDGTHYIFREDPDVLFISVHRHDHGTYYPAGDVGSYLNCGSGSGEGSCLNIPLNYLTKQNNPLPYQSPGDNQYIYLYNRIIHPILQEFDPQFILISSGFDAARYDPIGEFTVTPNAYYYITRRIMELNKPFLCVLQGGYNLKSLSQSVCSVVQALIGGRDLPEQCQLKYEEVGGACHIENEYHIDFDETIQHHSKYWKSLIAEEQIKYTKQIKSNSCKKFGIVDKDAGGQNENVQQVQLNMITNGKISSIINSESTVQFNFAGGHMQRFKKLSINNQRIMKWAYSSQRKFYESNFPQKQFIPKFYGVEGEYVIIQNLLYGNKQPIILDIKLSRQTRNPNNTPEKVQKELKKETLSTSHKYSFRIGGFTSPNFKQGGMLINDQVIIRKILSTVLTPENKQLFSSFLRRLSEVLKEVRRHYFGTSILLIRGKDESRIRWVDFHYWYDNQETYDESTVQGLQNLISFIQSTEPS